MPLAWHYIEFIKFTFKIRVFKYLYVLSAGNSDYHWAGEKKNIGRVKDGVACFILFYIFISWNVYSKNGV